MKTEQREASSLLSLIVLGALFSATWTIASIVIFGTIRLPF